MHLHFVFVVAPLGRGRGWDQKSQSGAFGSSSFSVLLVWSRRATVKTRAIEQPSRDVQREWEHGVPCDHAEEFGVEFLPWAFKVSLILAKEAV